MRLGNNCAIFALCTLLGAVSGTASAASLSFTGTFAGDDQLEIFSFVAGPGSAILIRSGAFVVRAGSASVFNRFVELQQRRWPIGSRGPR
jgi:hypothetical protein